MAVGDPLSKNTDYADIIDSVKMRVNINGDPLLKDSILYKEAGLRVAKWAGILSDAGAPDYLDKFLIENSLTGTANPYLLDLSSVDPPIWRLIKVVHINAAGTRTNVKPRLSSDAEDEQQLTNMNSTSIWYVNKFDQLEFYKGSAFVVTIASDDIEGTYYRQADITSIVPAKKIDIKDMHAHIIATDLTSTIKSYKGLDNTREINEMTDYKNQIISQHKVQ